MKTRCFSRMLAAIILLTVLVSCAGKDEPVAFPDPNFEMAVRDVIGKPSGEIFKSDVAKIKALNVSYRNISSLSGIEHFTGLTQLFCFNNQLTELDLGGNPALQELGCWDNQLTGLDVSGNTALRTLSCDDGVTVTGLDESRTSVSRS